MRYFIRFSYDGTDFHGSQTQPNGITVQESLEQALSLILRTPTPVTFAGRTDAGVHATCMWAHFDCALTAADAAWESKLILRLNSLLPDSIAVSSLRPVRDEAHARFDATSRRYEYHICTRKDPFQKNRSARVAPGLDFEQMNRAAQILLGRHDFASFCKVHTDVKTTFCTVTHAEWTVLPSDDDGNRHAFFTIEADRFLRNMVRAVVGTLFDVGRGKITLDDLRRIIDDKNRCSAGQSAPAAGLYLVHVGYPDSIWLT